MSGEEASSSGLHLLPKSTPRVNFMGDNNNPTNNSPDEDVHTPPPQEEINNAPMYLGNLFLSPLDPKRLLVLKGTFAGRQAEILVNGGAQGNFVSTSFVKKHRLHAHKKSRPTSVALASGPSLTHCTHSLVTPLQLSKTYTSALPLDVIPLNFDIILGLPWL